MELNGKPATLEQIRSLALTNYGHFTSMLVEDHRVRGLSLHLQRLARDCRQLFDLELDIEQVRHYVRHALTDGPRRTVARVTVYDPALDLATIGHDADPRILVTTRAAADSPAPPLRLQAASYRREIPAVKHIGLFGSLQRRRAAQREGFDDVLFLNPDGSISEIATSNVGFVRNGEILWPRTECLRGTTMILIQQALDEPVISESLTLSDLSQMEASFATNAATGVRSVVAVDGTQWASEHTVVRDLRALYLEIPTEAV